MAEWRITATAACCVKPYIFRCERIPSNLRFFDFLKVAIIIFQNPLQKLRIFTFWLFLGGGGGGVWGGGGGGGGGHFDEKIQKISLFQRLWGESDHNSINN